MQKQLAMALVLALVTVACGSEDSGDPGEATDVTSVAERSTESTAESSSEPDSQEPSAPQGLPPGGTGRVTVDGTAIDSEWVGNCLIDEMFDPHPDDLDLTAGLGSGIDALFVEIFNEEVGSGLMTSFNVELQRRGDDGYVNYEMVTDYVKAPDGNWYQDEDGALSMQLMTGRDIESEPLSEPPITIADRRVTGGVTLQDDSGSEMLDVTFDLGIVEAVDCSL